MRVCSSSMRSCSTSSWEAMSDGCGSFQPHATGCGRGGAVHGWALLERVPPPAPCRPRYEPSTSPGLVTGEGAPPSPALPVGAVDARTQVDLHGPRQAALRHAEADASGGAERAAVPGTSGRATVAAGPARRVGDEVRARHVAAVVLLLARVARGVLAAAAAFAASATVAPDRSGAAVAAVDRDRQRV